MTQVKIDLDTPLIREERQPTSKNQPWGTIGLGFGVVAVLGCLAGSMMQQHQQHQHQLLALPLMATAKAKLGLRTAVRSSLGLMGSRCNNFRLNKIHQSSGLSMKSSASTVKEPEIRISSPLKIEAVLFDLDGTLLDFEGGSHDCLNKVLAAYNSTGKARLTWEMHGTIVGRRASEWSSEILEQCGIPPSELTGENYVKMYLEKMPEYYPDMPLMPGALDLVKKLKAAGYKVAVASSSEGVSIQKKLSFHPELLGLMDIIQPGDDPEIKRGKPAPDIFLAAARKLGVAPENCLVFEDSPFGLQGAKAGNMACAAIPDSRMPIADPARFGTADFVLNSMEEFKMDYIEKI